MAIAHITFEDNQKILQSLKEHCLNTAAYAKESLITIGFGELGYISGLLHDMGKGTDVFDAYITKASNGESVIKGSVNHTFAGVIYILDHYHKDSDNLFVKLTSEIIAYAIGAHHGLFDCVSLEDENGFIHRLKKSKKIIYYDEACEFFMSTIATEQEIDRLFKGAVAEVEDFINSLKGKREAFSLSMMSGFLGRLVLSAVIFGDRKDTRQFMSQRSDTYISICWKDELEVLEKKLLGFSENSSLNIVRKDISRQCAEAASKRPGLYQLNVPTGGGKTLSALRYALNHAEKYRKKRIFFVIPLLSILDQNAEVIKENVKNPDIVLEHHSNVVKENMTDNELDLYELLTDTWNAPIVITTLVQLLNTMFSGKTSEVGRFQALVDSIIVIDEIQSLPSKTICMFNRMINFLTTYCNTTVVFSSATQPELSSVQWPVLYAAEPQLVNLTKNQIEPFNRYKIINCIDPYGKELYELAELGMQILETHKALLVICNTKGEARKLYQLLGRLNVNPACTLYHLSTSMCKTHRMQVLDKIKEELDIIQRGGTEENRKIICVSTQLVEAGIDFSFDSVIRILAGLDNLAQAAGRCNRSNEYGKSGDVYLVNLKNESASLTHLPEIMAAQKATQRAICSNTTADLINAKTTKLFYNYLYKELDGGRDKLLFYPVDSKTNSKGVYLAELLEKNTHIYNSENKKFFLRQPFKYIGEKFSVFEESTTDVIVPYAEGKEMIAKMRKLDSYHLPIAAAIDLITAAKSYTISIFENEKNELQNIGWLEPMFDGRVYCLSESLYREDIGFSKEIETFL